MIIFITEGNTTREEIKRLQEYMDETNSGIVVVVIDIDAVKVERK